MIKLSGGYMKDKYVEMLRELVLELAKCEIDYKIDFSDNVKRLILFDKFEICLRISKLSLLYLKK